MRFESWLAPLIPGVLLAALGSWGAWELLEDRRLVELAERSPERQDIAQAYREKVAPGSPPRIGSRLRSKTPPHILPGQSCREVATHAFVLKTASEDLETALQLGRYDQAMVARGLRSGTGSLLWTLGSLGLGAFFIVVALRTRRQLAAELAQALAVAGRPRRRIRRDADSHEGAPYRANEAVALLLPRPLALRWVPWWAAAPRW